MIYLLSFISVISLITTLLLVWYIRRLLTMYRQSITDMMGLFEMLEDFREGLEKVYNMDVYYGDNTIEGLLKNVKDLSDEIDSFLEESERNLKE